MIDHNGDYVNPLAKPNLYKLEDCLAELKFGRPAVTQMLLDTMIAMAKKSEKDHPSTFC